MRERRVLPILLALAVGACGDGGGPSDPDPDPTPSTGRLTVTVSGLPDGAGGAVEVTGPGGFKRTVEVTTTLSGIAPGAYSLKAREIVASELAYGTDWAIRYAEVAAGGEASASVEYQPFNLRLDGLYITQSIQRFDGSVPLVAGRDGLLRVFAHANILNQVMARVRVRIYHDGVLADTLTIAPQTFAAPTSVQEASMGTSWNALLPGSMIRPGMSVEVDIDPDGAVKEADEADNAHAASPDVRTLPPFRLVLVPVRHGGDARAEEEVRADVEAKKDALVSALLRMFPIADYEVSVRRPFSTSTTLRPDSGWTALLGEIRNLGAEDPGAYYYGVARIDYPAGIYGIAYRPGKAGLGNDFVDGRNLDGPMTLAHEIGHSMGRPHSRCNVEDTDPDYPHPNGQIGAYGYDRADDRLLGPSTRDLMGYCEDRWIGDYTYEKVLQHRENAEAALAVVNPVIVVDRAGRLNPD